MVNISNVKLLLIVIISIVMYSPICLCNDGGEYSPSGYISIKSDDCIIVFEKEKHVSYKAVYNGGELEGVNYEIGKALVPHLGLNKLKQGLNQKLTNDTIVIISGIDALDCMDLSIFNVKDYYYYNIYVYNPNNHQRNIQPFSVIPWGALRAWYAYNLAKQQVDERCAVIEKWADNYTHVTKTLLTGNIIEILDLLRNNKVLKFQSAQRSVCCLLSVVCLSSGEINGLKSFEFYIPYPIYSSWNFYLHESLLLRDINP